MGAFYRMFLAFLHILLLTFFWVQMERLRSFIMPQGQQVVDHSLPPLYPPPKEQLMLTSERNRIMRFGQLVNHGTEFPPGTMKALMGTSTRHWQQYALGVSKNGGFTTQFMAIFMANTTFETMGELGVC